MEFSGVLHQIDNIVNKESKDGRIYSSRTFILKYTLENRDQYVKFYLDPPNLNVIEKFEVGQLLTVKFNLMGWITKGIYNPDETVVMERKVVFDIKLDPKAASFSWQKPRVLSQAHDGYVGPDFTMDFSKFPEQIAF